jgi:hypothetical protein
MSIKAKRPLSWIFPLPVWSHSILMGSNAKPDPENIGIVVGISLISCLRVELQAFEVWRPPSWSFPLPVWAHSILMGPNGKPDLKSLKRFRNVVDILSVSGDTTTFMLIF